MTSRILALSAILIAAFVGCGGGGGADSSTASARTSEDFRAAVEARDVDGILATFADDIRLYSPVLPDPFEGIAQMRVLFPILAETFRNIEIVEGIETDGLYVFWFRAEIDGQRVEVVDLLRFDESGRIDEFTVTMRPLPGINALAAAVAPHLPEILGASSGG